MRNLLPASKLAAAALLCAASQLATADWTKYDAPTYGYSMLVPEGTKMTSRELGGGWGQLWGNSDGVKLYGLAKLGAKESDADIEKYAVKVIGIPASKWKMVDSGSGRGFERYRTFEAVSGDKLYFGGYGVGRQGNYLLYLETTVEDYDHHKADYRKWYDSIRVY
ncbi:MAG TPA: hypothetical protein VN598_01745 [Usitatibacter sp.]|nr:hypothetical protein [Usitatibacter sp.]